ncbi:MAG TPA: hypothetical protein VF691_13155 [Cytophagaceae bacterium]|jgi:phosphodiesterase/alkaline phosphatase D-like protein
MFLVEIEKSPTGSSLFKSKHLAEILFEATKRGQKILGHEETVWLKEKISKNKWKVLASGR